MSADIDERVTELGETQALQACDALTIILGEHLKGVTGSHAAKAANLDDLQKLLDAARPEEKTLSEALASGTVSDEEVVGTAKAMLLLAADLGFEEQVNQALVQGEMHQRDLGLLSVPLILGGLAVVLAWVPLEERTTLSTARTRDSDGTWTETQTTETYTRRVGAEAAKAFADWLGAFGPKTQRPAGSEGSIPRPVNPTEGE